MIDMDRQAMQFTLGTFSRIQGWHMIQFQTVLAMSEVPSAQSQLPREYVRLTHRGLSGEEGLEPERGRCAA